MISGRLNNPADISALLDTVKKLQNKELNFEFIMKPLGNGDSDRLHHIRSIEVGDMILVDNQPRLVRAIKVCKNQSRYYKAYFFAIKRKSWTNRCYTVYNETDLMTKFGGIIKTNCPLVRRSGIEARTQEAIRIASSTDMDNDKQIITADEMAGMVR